jgi:CheY-like chemotaxis protein
VGSKAFKKGEGGEMTNPTQGQPYVLVADDDPLMIRSLQIILRGAGFVVLGVPDGATALQQIRAEKPVLAILDVMMARMNGLDLCRAIKADEDLRDVKVFLLTARAMPSERQQGLAAGADAYITKPFANSELVARVRHALTPPSTVPPPASSSR